MIGIAITKRVALAISRAIKVMLANGYSDPFPGDWIRSIGGPGKMEGTNLSRVEVSFWIYENPKTQANVSVDIYNDDAISPYIVATMNNVGRESSWEFDKNDNPVKR